MVTPPSSFNTISAILHGKKNDVIFRLKNKALQDKDLVKRLKQATSKALPTDLELISQLKQVTSSFKTPKKIIQITFLDKCYWAAQFVFSCFNPCKEKIALFKEENDLQITAARAVKEENDLQITAARAVDEKPDEVLEEDFIAKMQHNLEEGSTYLNKIKSTKEAAKQLIVCRTSLLKTSSELRVLYATHNKKIENRESEQKRLVLFEEILITEQAKNAKSKEIPKLQDRIGEIRNSLDSYTTKITELSAKIPQLRQSVQELEQQIAAFTKEVGMDLSDTDLNNLAQSLPETIDLDNLLSHLHTLKEEISFASQKLNDPTSESLDEQALKKIQNLELQVDTFLSKQIYSLLNNSEEEWIPLVELRPNAQVEEETDDEAENPSFAEGSSPAATNKPTVKPEIESSTKGPDHSLAEVDGLSLAKDDVISIAESESLRAPPGTPEPLSMFETLQAGLEEVFGEVTWQADRTVPGNGAFIFTNAASIDLRSLSFDKIQKLFPLFRLNFPNALFRAIYTSEVFLQPYFKDIINLSFQEKEANTAAIKLIGNIFALTPDELQEFTTATPEKRYDTLNAHFHNICMDCIAECIFKASAVVDGKHQLKCSFRTDFYTRKEFVVFHEDTLPNMFINDISLGKIGTHVDCYIDYLNVLLKLLNQQLDILKSTLNKVSPKLNLQKIYNETYKTLQDTKMLYNKEGFSNIKQAFIDSVKQIYKKKHKKDFPDEDLANLDTIANLYKAKRSLESTVSNLNLLPFKTAGAIVSFAQLFKSDPYFLTVSCACLPHVKRNTTYTTNSDILRKMF